MLLIRTAQRHRKDSDGVMVQPDWTRLAALVAPSAGSSGVVTEELEGTRSPTLGQCGILGRVIWGYGGEKRRAPAKARQIKSYWRAIRTLSCLAPRLPRGNSKQVEMLREQRAGLLYAQRDSPVHTGGVSRNP